MNIFLNLAKKWWVWVAIVVFIIIVWQQMSSWALSKKLYNMALDNLRTDQSQTIKDKDAWIKQCEDEIARQEKEKEQIRLEKIALEKKDKQSMAEIAQLMGRNHDLQDRLDRIIISDDPDRLLEDLRSRGINIKKYNR